MPDPMNAMPTPLSEPLSEPRSEPMPHVLIVEDDEAMALALADGFRFEGYEVDLASDGRAALERLERLDQDGAETGSPDLVILDVMLPKVSGLDVCRTIRSRGDRVPIIMLTARGQEIDKVLGLKMGADDYVTKPFSFMELLARAEAIRRRVDGSLARTSEVLTFGEVEVDFQHHRASRAGEPLDLSAREFELLRYFSDRRGEVVTREELLNAVWGYDSIPFTRTVDVHIAKLRKKIEEVPGDPQHLVTIHRVGYKFAG